MMLQTKFLKSVHSDDGFFSIKKNKMYYKTRNQKATPWVIGMIVSAGLGLSPVAAVCMGMIIWIVAWDALIKHLCRFVFIVYYTKYNEKGEVIYEKPLPPCLRVDPNDPFK